MSFDPRQNWRLQGGSTQGDTDVNENDPRYRVTPQMPPGIGVQQKAAGPVTQTPNDQHPYDPNYYAQQYNDMQYNIDPRAYVLGGSVEAQKQAMNELAARWGGAQGRAPIQAKAGVYNSDLALAGQSRDSQNDALSYWQRASMGKDLSPAQRQYMLGAQMASANNMSAAAGARGGGPAAVAAQRAAAFANTANAAQAANGMQALRAQEMQAAMAGYSNAANGIRGQDQALSALDAQWAQGQAQLANAQRGRDDARQQGYAGLYMDTAQANADRGASNYNSARGVVAVKGRAAYDQNERDAQRMYAMYGAGANAAAQGIGALASSAGSAATAPADPYASGGRNAKNPYDQY